MKRTHRWTAALCLFFAFAAPWAATFGPTLRDRLGKRLAKEGINS